MKYLNQYISQYNAMAKHFKSMEELKIPTTPEECKPFFVRLSNELSPESLTCDGERSPAQVRMRAKFLWNVWFELEKIFGREVDEGEF